MLAEWLVALEGTSLATGLRNSLWAYPLVNTGHILGIALLVGGSAPLSLRILGAWKAIPLEPLRKALSRTADAGFLLALACGFLLFSARASAYARSGLFVSKMLLLLLAAAGTLGMRLLSARAAAGGRPGPARAAAAFSLAAWLAVLTLGRLIGYF